MPVACWIIRHGHGEVDIVCMAKEECEGGGENVAMHMTSSAAHLLLSFFEGVTKHRVKYFLTFSLCNFTLHDVSLEDSCCINH